MLHLLNVFGLPKFHCIPKKAKVKQILATHVAYKNVFHNHTQLLLKMLYEPHPTIHYQGLDLWRKTGFLHVHSAKLKVTPNRLCGHTQQIPPIVMSPPPSHLVDWREDYYLHMKATSFHWHVKVN